MHHISKYFEDPWDFKPERWLPDAPKYAFVLIIQNYVSCQKSSKLSL